MAGRMAAGEVQGAMDTDVFTISYDTIPISVLQTDHSPQVHDALEVL